MKRTEVKTATPNDQIDGAIGHWLKKAKELEPEMAAKIIAQAIAWEKCKHQIVDKQDEGFDPDL